MTSLKTGCGLTEMNGLLRFCQPEVKTIEILMYTGIIYFSFPSKGIVYKTL